MIRRKLLSFAVAAALSATRCAPPPPAPGAPPSREIARDAAAALAALRAREPLLLPPPRMAPAPWLAPPVEPPIDAGLDEAEPLFAGREAALASTRAGTFAIHARFGAVGPLHTPPGTVWVGLDGSGGVLAATGEGELLRAPDVRAAQDAAAFARAGAVPGAIAWDANGPWIAAITRHSAALSKDGGRSFADLGPGGDAALEEVFVRSDGVVVATSLAAEDTPAAAWIGGPGRRLRRSPHEVAGVTRAGDWIGRLAWCPVVLSSDGARWAEVARSLDDADRARWVRALSPTSTLEAFARDPFEELARFTPPPPPAVEPSWRGGCHRRTKPPRLRMGSTSGPILHCAGAAFLGGHTEGDDRASRVALALLRDGRCAPDVEDPGALNEEGDCKPDAPLARAPSAVVLDRATGGARAIAAPPGCRPERLLSAAGVGVLLCAEKGRAALHVGDGAGIWHAEGALPLNARDATSLVMAPDGTLLLRALWARGPDKRAFVRSPLPLGEARAWREVDVRDAFEVRADVGGAALLFTTGATAPIPQWFSVLRDAPDEPRRALTGRVPIEGSLVDAAIEGRRVFVWIAEELYSDSCGVRAGPAGRHHPRWMLARGGALVPAP